MRQGLSNIIRFSGSPRGWGKRGYGHRSGAGERERSGVKSKKIRPNFGPQTLLLRCPYFEVFYGGSRGAAKTLGLLLDYAQDIGRGWGHAWRGIIVRKTYKQLEDVIIKSKWLFYKIFPGAKYNETDYTWWFPTGESLVFRHLKTETDAENYQGHEYPFVGFDELTTWPDDGPYEKLKVTCRATAPGVRRRIRATGNPLGPGHQWVKARFIDPAPPFQKIVNDKGLVRIFIKARIYDNPPLLLNNPEYVAQLEAIEDENLRKAWLDGDWDVIPGGFFAGIWKREVHTIPTFLPSAGWILYRSFDYGAAKPFSVGWWAIADGSPAPDGCIYPRGARIRWAEWYGMEKGKPNTGLNLSSTQIAEGILEREKVFQERVRFQYGQKAWKLRIWPGPAGADIFDQGRAEGPTIAKKMANRGVQWERADIRPGSRISGADTFKTLLKGEDGIPRLYVMDRCTDFLRTVPILERDEKIWDDVDTDQEDHAYDEARYACNFRGPRIPSGTKYWK